MSLNRWQLSDICVVAKSIATEFGYRATNFYRSTSYIGYYMLHYQTPEIASEVSAILSLSGIDCILEGTDKSSVHYKRPVIKINQHQSITSLDYAGI